MDRNIREEESLVGVRHIRAVGARAWADVCASVEAQLGPLDLGLLDKMLKAGRSQRDIQAEVLKHQGPLGLLLFGSLDHGAGATLGGKPEKAKQYVVGNPFIAQQMTIHDIRAGLYAPLRMYVYALGPKETAIDYDLPSSLFGQFGNEQVAPVAKSLDEKMQTLVTNALKS